MAGAVRSANNSSATWRIGLNILAPGIPVGERAWAFYSGNGHAVFARRGDSERER
jgi:hypothetical protein